MLKKILLKISLIFCLAVMIPPTNALANIVLKFKFDSEASMNINTSTSGWRGVYGITSGGAVISDFNTTSLFTKQTINGVNWYTYTLTGNPISISGFYMQGQIYINGSYHSQSSGNMLTGRTIDADGNYYLSYIVNAAKAWNFTANPVANPDPTVTLTVPSSIYTDETISFSAVAQNVTSPVYTYSVKAPGASDFTQITAPSPYSPTSGLGNYIFKVEVAASSNLSTILASQQQTVTVKERPQPITVKTKVPAAWGTRPIGIYFWGGATTTNPVATTEENIGGIIWYTYTFAPTETAINVIFINGTSWSTNPNQTVDITGITSSKCFEVVQDGTNKCKFNVIDCPIPVMVLEPGDKLNVQSGQTLTVGTLTLKADKAGSSFSAKIDGTINATTVRFFKTIDDSKWYFLSFPCDITVNNITKSDGSSLGVLGTDWFIKYYDGNKRSNDGVSNGSNWLSITVGSTLSAKKGYIFGLKSGTADTELLFPLSTSVLTAETAQNVSVLSYASGVAGGNHLGWNLVGQPYLSKFASQSGSNAPFMILSDGISTYTSYSKALNQLPIINPFDAYFVQANGSFQTSGLDFALVGRQSAPKSVTNNLSENVELLVTSTTGIDNTYIIMDDDQSTEYQIGQDLEKWIGTGTDKPQLYTILGGVNYAFNALPLNNVLNLPVGIYTKNSGSVTLSSNASKAPSLSKLLLTDNTNGNTTDLLISDYNFNALPGTDNNRFTLSIQRVSTENNVTNKDVNEPTITTINGKLTLGNLSKSALVRVYDVIGQLVFNKVVYNSLMEIPLSVDGIYIVQIDSGYNKWIKKIVKK